MSHRASHLALVEPLSVQDPIPAKPSDRRSNERLTMSALAWLNRVRLKYGPQVSLIDLSPGGAQIETSGHRLQPGANVVVEIGGEEGEFVLPSRVLRCSVSAIAPHPTYRGALEFKRRFDLPDTQRIREADVAAGNPIHEHARLAAALKRLSGMYDVPAGREGLTSVGAVALSAAHALIESPLSRRGLPFANEVSPLIRTVAHAVENNASPGELGSIIAERLRRSVPARTIRLLDASAASSLQSAELIAFDVPSAPGVPKKLVVEFPSACRLEEWHFQLLKIAANLIALTAEIEHVRELADEHARREALRGDIYGWNRLVIRYTDGRVLKGFGRDFLPAKGHVHVWSVPDGPPDSRLTIPLAQLKAVFFVHDFEGAPPAASGQAILAGRRIVVNFLDGELLEGTTLNYAAKGPGFFVTPADAASNNHRVFVINGAVRHVQFL